jgi:hypothetical protein
VEPVEVYDPLNTMNNTTRMTFRFFEVQKVFAEMHMTLLDEDIENNVKNLLNI